MESACKYNSQFVIGVYESPSGHVEVRMAASLIWVSPLWAMDEGYPDFLIGTPAAPGPQVPLWCCSGWFGLSGESLSGL